MIINKRLILICLAFGAYTIIGFLKGWVIELDKLPIGFIVYSL